MKFTKKASVPIGTIAIIIIVLVASFGMWWWFTQDGQDCSDVVDDGPSGLVLHSWHIQDLPFPRVRETTEQWMFTYENTDGNYESRATFGDLGHLETVRLDSVDNISSQEKARLLHIFHCIHEGWGY